MNLGTIDPLSNIAESATGETCIRRKNEERIEAVYRLVEEIKNRSAQQQIEQEGCQPCK